MNFLYSNSNSRKDHLRFELEKYAINTNLFIASAFFSNHDFIKKAVSNNCEIKLIVRLSIGTSVPALKEVINLNNVYIRYYTSDNFHPKIYIFGNQIAFVGSSNLTGSGLISNQEINVGILSDDPRFETLQNIFNEYWNYAEVLTEETINDYYKIVSEYDSKISEIENTITKKIKDQFKDVNFPNIGRDVIKKTKENIFVSTFLKNYQVFLDKHQALEEIYKYHNKRKVDENNLPLRLELDQFLSWIRDKKAYSENFLKSPVRKKDELFLFIPKIIDEFMTDNIDFDWIINNYNRINKNFSNINNIDQININDLYDTLLVIHSFYGRFRFFHDGHQTMKKTFLDENSEKKIKKTIKFLLYGKGNFLERIAKCIYDEDYKLNNFGESNVKELYGWINTDNVPICNDRTLKSLQWLGFGNLM